MFYVLPKIHKPGFPPAGRPIVAAQGCLHEPVSRCIDSFLQPFVQKTGSFLQDTTDFINKVEGTSISNSSLILSFDVISLYTNVPHEELRMVLQEVFDKREILHPPSHFLLDLVDFLTDFNYFRFDCQYYLQIKGIAMGSAFAPSAANLFMDHFERTHILNTSNPYEHISNYHRYIDNIFCIYDDPSSFPAFQEWLNQLHPSIKFTFSGDSKSVNFLATTVFRTKRNTFSHEAF